MSDSQSKAALVTGASRGIGKAIALKLADCGYDIVVNYASRKDAADEVVKAIEAKGRKAIALGGSVSDFALCETLVEDTVAHFGRIDVLVNNAGITRDTLLIRMKDDDFLDVINTNLNGPFFLCRAAAKVMMKQRTGAIVNIASISGIYGNPGQANYSASKAGLIGMTKAIAKELGSRGVTVNAVAPGFISTDMTEGLENEQILSHIPMKRFGQAEDVANAVAFLVTSGDYITGQVIQVDGGLVI
jgi:3-oxoacyl-[acyl-carrier protein] reductase